MLGTLISIGDPRVTEQMIPFRGALAPDEPKLPAMARQGPQVVTYRPPVQPTANVPSWRSVSAGAEVARIPEVFDAPARLRNIYRGIRGGMRTTLLAPELQAEIGPDAAVMARRGVNVPYKVTDPGPWYQSFVKTIG